MTARIRAVLGVAYMLLAGVGLVLASYQPAAVVSELGRTLTVWTGVALAVGGLLTTAGLRARIWWLERAALLLIAAGMAGYGSTLVHYEGIDPPELAARAGASAAVAALAAYRWLTISGADLDPEG